MASARGRLHHAFEETGFGRGRSLEVLAAASLPALLLDPLAWSNHCVSDLALMNETDLLARSLLDEVGVVESLDEVVEVGGCGLHVT